MKKFYYYIYYRIYQFSIKISDDALNEIKPGSTIILLELLLITQLFIWIELFQLIPETSIGLLWSTPILMTVVFLLILFNYFIFLYREKWKKYDKEFGTYTKNKKRLLDYIVITIIIGIVAGFIFAFYRFYKA
jgi:heme/copper-type cytochrome/quinol oxidase subunit 2